MSSGYQGPGQPTVAKSGGLFGGLSSLFRGGEGPTYAGAGQPAFRGGGLLPTRTPAYQQAPSTPMEQNGRPEDTSLCTHDAAHAVIACPEECDPFSAGPIAIIVPRHG